MTMNILTAFRPLSLTAVLGDSRVAQIFTTQTITSGSQIPASLSGYNHFNWGNARAGHRLKPAYSGGLSGDRSDQMLARLSAAINSGAGSLYIQIGVNDVSQAQAGYTTVNTVGPNQGVVVSTANVAAVCFANIQYAAQQFLRAGGRAVIIVLEYGSEAFNTAQIGACIDLNQMVREFAEVTQGVLPPFDAWTSMHDPAASSTTTIRFKAGYAQEASGSGVHQGNAGGYGVGKDFATYLTANYPPVSFLPGDVNEVTGNSVRNQLLNPLFVTASGGTTGTGTSGTMPGSWTSNRGSGSGTQTAVMSVGTPADGTPGKECIMACTFSAAGDLLRIQQDAVNANWNIGDVIEGVAQVSVDSGGALAGVFMDMQQNDGSATQDIRDLSPFNNVAIGTEGCTLFLRTPPFVITGKAGSPFLTMRLYAQGSAAGSATVRWRQVQIRKRFAV